MSVERVVCGDFGIVLNNKFILLQTDNSYVWSDLWKVNNGVKGSNCLVNECLKCIGRTLVGS